jgi:hypothetical protein
VRAQKALKPRSTPRPPLHQINAAGLVKLGLIDAKELRNYARTGNFDGAAQRKIQAFQSNGTLSFYDMNTGEHLRTDILPGSGGNAMEMNKKRRDDLRSQTKYAFLDREGNFDKRTYNQFENAFEELNAYLGAQGFSTNDPQFVNAMAEGFNTVYKFDEDRLQGLNTNRWDFTWGDWKPPVNASNVAIASQLADAGLRGLQADFALRSYIKSYENVVPKEELLQQVGGIEKIVQDKWQDFQSGETIKLPNGKPIDQGGIFAWLTGTTYGEEDFRQIWIDAAIEQGISDGAGN